MFTKVFLKSVNLLRICTFVLAILCTMQLTASAWIRNDTATQMQTEIAKSMVEKTTRSCLHILRKDILTIGMKVFLENLQGKEKPEAEQNLEDFIIEEVLRVCTEVYPDLDPNYVLAIIYHESRFKPDVVNSKSNATGLMQILPKWHTARAQRLGVELTDPAGNILVGCDILNEVYQQSKSMRYSLNVYAGGYAYADNYKTTKSQFEKELDEIIASGVLYSIGR